MRAGKSYSTQRDRSSTGRSLAKGRHADTLHDPSMRSIAWIESRRELDHDLFARAPVRKIDIVGRGNEGVCSNPPTVDIHLFVGRVCLTGEKEVEEREVVSVKCDIGTFKKAIRLGVVEKVQRGRH